MFNFAMLDNGVYAQRSGRVIQCIAVKNPELIKPYIAELTNKLLVAKSEGLRRSILKILIDYYIELNEDELGRLADTCFEWVLANNKPVIKIYSLEILYRISNLYTDLKPELKTIIENIIPHESSGIKSRGKKMLQTLNWEINH
ncbi:MAG: hypothetical protein K9G76_02415 [Bacteroidales bacterium]|nr:hypothetical protein [Bacteroidales bacterium]